jgi:hypothetical protein
MTMPEPITVEPSPKPKKKRKKLGRPAYFNKPLAKTFMMSQEAFDLLERKAAEIPCSRSDALEMAIRAFAHMPVRRRGLPD